MSLQQQAISICQHNQLMHASCHKVGPKQSYKEARVTFLIYGCSAVEHFIEKPKFNLRDKVRIANQVLPSKIGYKQSFMDKVFTINKISTFNPSTYNLRDDSGDTINRQFYEPEHVKVNGRI